MSGLAEVLAAHLFTLYPGEIECDCEWTKKDDDSRAADERMIAAHVEHLAAAVTTWLTERLASKETAQRGAAVYWNHRQGVPLDAWTPPIEVESMQAALTAVTEALREGAS